MALDSTMTDIARLAGRVENRPENRHDLYFELRAKLNEIPAMGISVPNDVLQFERELEVEFTADRKERSTPPAAAATPQERRAIG